MARKYQKRRKYSKRTGRKRKGFRRTGYKSFKKNMLRFAEKKYVDTVIDLTQVPGPEGLNFVKMLPTMPIGITDQQRIGHEVTMKRLEIRHAYALDADYDSNIAYAV